MNNELFAVMLLWATMASLTLADVFTAEQESQLDDLVNSVMKCYNIPGLTMAVVKGDSTWRRGYGVRNRDTGQPVTTSTLFNIASMSKAFTTAVLASILDDDDRYDWDTRLIDILGKDFRLGTDELTNHVTLKDLLTHRTGLSTDYVLLDVGFPPNLTREELEKRIRFLPVTGEFRDRYAYSNWGYALAGRVAEVMGGASWEDLLLTRILQPLNMTDTKVIGHNVEVDDDIFARPYMKVGNDVIENVPWLYHLSPMEPAGSVASSADDMVKWLLFHLSNGRTPDGATVVSEQRMREMHSPYTLMPFNAYPGTLFQPQYPIATSAVGYGYAWRTSIYRGRRVVSHTGSLDAYRSRIAFLPDEGVGMFVSTTGPAQDVRIPLLYHVTDLVLGFDQWLNATTICTFPEPWETEEEGNYDGPLPVAGPVSNPDAYVGTYGNQLYGDIEVINSDPNHLTLTFNNLQANLYNSNQTNVFLLEGLPPLRLVTLFGNTTWYIRIEFTEPTPRSGGSYKILKMLDVARVPLVFDRDVRFSDPVVEGHGPNAPIIG